MDTLLENIKKFMEENNKTFFSYAWRENLLNQLNTDSKYQALVDWINKNIKFYQVGLNVFNPADKTECYTTSMFNDYQDSCKNLAMLLNFKNILIDDKCTTAMRDNIEYTICKIYHIKYDDNLHIYLTSVNK